MSRLDVSQCNLGVRLNVLRDLVSTFKTTEPMKKPDKWLCVPFFHVFSHDVKALAESPAVRVAFENDFKLSTPTPFSDAHQGCKKNKKKTGENKDASTILVRYSSLRNTNGLLVLIRCTNWPQPKRPNIKAQKGG